MKQGMHPRVAVIGCGYWGKNLVRNFAAAGALAAVHDQEPATTAAMAERYGVPAPELDELLTDDDIEAVAIAAPAAQHFTLARRALHAGKHVFVEKPLALDVAEAEELCSIAEEGRRTLMVGHLLHTTPPS
jgi:UDP-2-acetamido-3-amino-2,3-dideoxy-glucuronate N-acetyltransferase